LGKKFSGRIVIEADRTEEGNNKWSEGNYEVTSVNGEEVDGIYEEIRLLLIKSYFVLERKNPLTTPIK
jgi:hypothetical protein